MKLEIVPVRYRSKIMNAWACVTSPLAIIFPDSGFNRSNLYVGKKLEVLLSIQFNESLESLPSGNIRFGLKRGELRLHAKGCKMPIERRELGTLLVNSIQKLRSEQSGYEKQNSLDTSVGKDKLGFSGKKALKKTSNLTDEYQLNVGQVTKKGDDVTPGWEFEVQTGESCLKADIQRELLGVLDIEMLSCSLTATFNASLIEDLYIVSEASSWLRNISKLKLAFLSRILAKHFLEEKLSSHISQQEFSAKAIN